MLNINRKISQFNHYNTNTQTYLVIHYVGAQSSTAANNATYFAGGDRQASAHYFVDDTSIWQSVEDYHGAWHVGNTRTSVNNTNSIGIEMCCMGPNLQVTEITENNTGELAAYLCKKYNIPITNVKTHFEVTAGAKLCPNFANTARWQNMKSKIQSAINGQSINKITSEAPYRVRIDNKANTQIFASNTLDGAKSNCPKGYSVYDKNGTCLYTNTAQEVPVQTVKPVSNSTYYAEDGVFYFNTTVRIRTAPSVNGGDTGLCYYAGESVTYHHVYLNRDGYNWIQYTRANGQQGYCAVRDLATGERYGYAE